MLYIDYRIAAAYSRGQGVSGSNMLSQEALLSWEQAVSRYVPFLPPQWLPIGGNTAGDSFSRLNLELCLFWGLFVQQGPYFIACSPQTTPKINLVLMKLVISKVDSMKTFWYFSVNLFQNLYYKSDLHEIEV